MNNKIKRLYIAVDDANVLQGIPVLINSYMANQ